MRNRVLDIRFEDYRRAIRPIMVGVIGKVEPRASRTSAKILNSWLRRVIRESVSESGMRKKLKIRRSLTRGISVTGARSFSSLRGRIYAQPWVSIHVSGGIIKPTGDRKYLAIPLFSALRPDGRPKFRSPLSWKRFGTFVYKSKDGRKFIAYHPKGKRGLVIIYRLIDEVEIPQRIRLLLKARKLQRSLYNNMVNALMFEMSKSGTFNFWGAHPDIVEG